MHAVGTCHDELLAADAMAAMLLDCAANGKPPGEVLGALAPFATAPWHAIVGGGDPAATAEWLSRSQEGFALLRRGLEERVGIHAPGPAASAALATVATYDVFSGLLGIFELNNLSVDCEHPVDRLLFALENQLAADAPPLLARLGVDADAEPKALVRHLRSIADAADAARARAADNDAAASAAAVGEGRRFPALEGTALFRLTSCLNHSCSPNVESRYDNVDAPSAVTIVASRDIQAGEELCHAYIDDDADVTKRRAALRHYGFICECPRCVAEGGTYK